jgi:hypothetical protein
MGLLRLPQGLQWLELWLVPVLQPGRRPRAKSRRWRRAPTKLIGFSSSQISFEFGFSGFLLETREITVFSHNTSGIDMFILSGMVLLPNLDLLKTCSARLRLISSVQKAVCSQVFHPIR